jgi:hypothetical protein
VLLVREDVDQLSHIVKRFNPWEMVGVERRTDNVNGKIQFRSRKAPDLLVRVSAAEGHR